MAKVIGGHVIKANIIDKKTSINSSVFPKDSTVKSQITTTPSASTEKEGIIRIATDEEVINAESNSIAITPKTLYMATHYVHEQGIASDTWVINHNLNKFPSVTVVDSAGTQFYAVVKYENKNNCTVKMKGACKGRAFLN